MSDYLWDKTGDADPDTRRLEGLLGELRHRPRALELPAESSAGLAGAAGRVTTPRAFGRAGLAVAAALLLAALAGAFVALRQSNAGGVVVAVVPDSHTSPPAERGAEAVTAGGVAAPADELATRGIEADDRSAGERGSRRKRVRRAGVAVEVAAAREEERGRLAKEQLVYALRLTNFQLREVQRRARDIVDANDDRGGRERLR